MNKDKIRELITDKYQYSYETNTLFKVFADCLLDDEMHEETDEDTVLSIARDITIVHEDMLEKAKARIAAMR